MSTQPATLSHSCNTMTNSQPASQDRPFKDMKRFTSRAVCASIAGLAVSAGCVFLSQQRRQALPELPVTSYHPSRPAGSRHLLLQTPQTLSAENTKTVKVTSSNLRKAVGAQSSDEMDDSKEVASSDLLHDVTREQKQYTAEALADEIHKLPGLEGALPFRHFSGYLPVSKSKHYFYWFTQAITDPDNSPLVFWTNGGPGCSGIFGFMNENGPFRPNADGNVDLNPYTWNTVANMVFFEQPVDVGFSYTTDEADKVYGDAQAASDNYIFIQRFLERFPHYRSQDLYVAGESYGGHYLPTLSKEILDQNAQHKNPALNLKGAIIGNPLTDPVENLVGAMESFYGHSLIPQPLYNQWRSVCNPDDIETLVADKCVHVQTQAWTAITGLNPYALDYDVCLDGSGHAKLGQQGLHPIMPAGRNQRYKLLAYTWGNLMDEQFQQTSWNPTGLSAEYAPCQDNWGGAYLNRKDVQEAIHAKVGTVWGDCSDPVFFAYNREDRNSFMQPVYKSLVESGAGLRILVFSGADDSVCATQGTQRWIYNMGWKAKTAWTGWGINQQVAGYLQSFDNGVTFATVSGAGHEVPAYKPAEALALFASYLKGEFGA